MPYRLAIFDLDGTLADNQTVRNVFVLGPDKKIKLIRLSHDDRSKFRRGAARHRFTPADGEAQGRNPRELETG
jgi:hypothetical protein